MGISDQELLHRFRGGDAAAFELFFRRWDHRVTDLAFRLTGDREEARDVRQQAFIRLLRSLDGLNGGGRFSSWFYRVVLNLCVDRLRSRAARERVESEPTSGGERASTTCPRCRGEQKETACLVADAVEGLEPTDRVIVMLRHYQGCTFAEVAEILDLPASTVKTRMQRSLLALRSKLKHLET